MEAYELAWTFYAIGSLGCGIAAWLLVRRFGREWSHFFLVTVLALLLTPYAIETTDMMMAPALFIVVFDGIIEGFDKVAPIVMVLLGVWLVALVVSLIILLIARRFSSSTESEFSNKHIDEPSDEELHARDELLDGNIPMRAER